MPSSHGRAVVASGRNRCLRSNATPEDVILGDLGGLLAGLDRGQREVLLLHAWEELSYEEIAAALDIPVGTVRSRLARARAHLRPVVVEQPAFASDRPEVNG